MAPSQTQHTKYTQTSNNLAAFIWSVADLLRGDFKQSQYGRIILPFTLLRRLECVLEDTKEAVVAEYQRLLAMPDDDQKPTTEEAQARFLLRKTNKLAFYNTSPMTLAKMGQSDIAANLSHYIQSFSKDTREIFDHFKFEEFVGQLDDANLLYKEEQLPFEERSYCAGRTIYALNFMNMRQKGYDYDDIYMLIDLSKDSDDLEMANNSNDFYKDLLSEVYSYPVYETEYLKSLAIAMYHNNKVYQCLQRLQNKP